MDKPGASTRQHFSVLKPARLCRHGASPPETARIYRPDSQVRLSDLSQALLSRLVVNQGHCQAAKISTALWKNHVESTTYPRALCRGFYGQFVGRRHGHFVGQAYRFIPIESPIVGRARLWKAKTAFTQDAGPGDHGTYTHSQTQPQNQNLANERQKQTCYLPLGLPRCSRTRANSFFRSSGVSLFHRI